jgi:hypothetical protein
MGKMKEVYQLKQELLLKDRKAYENLPDSYFIDLYLQEQEYYESNVQLPQDTYDGGFIDEP